MLHICFTPVYSLAAVDVIVVAQIPVEIYVKLYAMLSRSSENKVSVSVPSVCNVCNGER